MDDRGETEVRFPPASGSGEVRGVLHRPPESTHAGLVLTHGRSNDMRNLFVKRLAAAASQAGLAAMRMNFRYADEKGRASKDLTREEEDLRGALRFLRKDIGDRAIFIAGKSMGARVCARSSSDPDVAGMIALGYPLHPQFRPQVRNPPEWPLIVKPALFVQGDQDPFCDLARLREELPRLSRPHELVVIRNAGHSFESRGEKRDTFPEVWAAVDGWHDGQRVPPHREAHDARIEAVVASRERHIANRSPFHFSSKI
jgi:predicted alpha/beta-hydrolase family hydrolase